MELTKRESHMKRRSHSSQRGMSLIEMMIACIVLLVGVVAVASLIPLAIGTNAKNRQQSNSTVIAQMIMEKTLLSNGDADFTQTAGSAGDPAGYYKLYTVCGSNGQQSIYDVRWHIVTPSPYVMQVTVSAKLQGSNNNAVLFSPTVSIRSMIGQGN